MAHNYTIVIIGAGVLGLSAALKLQAKLAAEATASHGKPPSQPQILLVAREWPSAIPGSPVNHSPDYASMWAGAHVRPIPAATPQLQREAAWLKETVAELGRLAAADPGCGLTRAKGVEYLEAPDESYRTLNAAAFADETGLPGYRRYEASELPDGVALGYEYDTFCVNPPMYCDALLRKFLLRGGRTLRRELRNECEAMTLADDVRLVVNASGAGFGDPKCFPTRGQTVVTNLKVDKTVTRQYRDGTWSFLIPRFFDGGTVVGGTKEPGDWRSTPCESTRKTLLENGLRLGFPQGGSSSSSSSSDIVGRRPTRQGGMRLEVEHRPVASCTKGPATLPVIHAYGAGGRGYEISWGVANQVVELAMPLVQGLSREQAARL
ncbi:hypothetical protein UVI_02042790 [Ustilaginoidea virens]|uniref:FAD dependent oxidoreductase domain-containing protein n=1 Tax=Ustilaginoidea virens TaxID=1159556 RepID=A0A1B5L3G6_USTVR|nr:hypothetical protein UVI_02042790 [Ustilaginoidea virens]